MERRKWVIVSIVVVVLLNMILISQYTSYERVGLDDVIVSSTKVEHESFDRIEIILDKGEFKEDNEPWSGQGPKWIGDFTIRLVNGDIIVHKSSLNDLLNPKYQESIFLYAPEFELVLEDYNEDGQPDFIITQYFSSNGSLYYLLTITNDLEIKPLEIHERYALFASPRTIMNSINLPHDDGWLTVNYYDNIEGEYFIDEYKWHNDIKKFILESHEINTL